MHERQSYFTANDIAYENHEMYHRAGIGFKQGTIPIIILSSRGKTDNVQSVSAFLHRVGLVKLYKQEDEPLMGYIQCAYMNLMVYCEQMVHCI